MAEPVTFILTFSPIILGCLLIFFPKLHKNERTHLLPILSVSFIFIALVAAFFIKSEPQFSFSWQPNAGEMSVIFGSSSLVLILLASVSLFILIIQNHRHSQNISPIQYSLMLFSYAFAICALAADHFLLRFAALEFVGLCVISTVLASSPKYKSGWDNVRNTFLNFKVGDLSLLAAILLMQANSGTFQIEQNINMALEFPRPIQIAITSGLMIAVWVKLSIWPLDRWVSAAANLPSSLRAWYIDLLLPILGAYLLYRTSPLLHSNANLATLFVILAISAVIIKISSSALKKQAMPHQRLMQIFSSICLIPLAVIGQQKVLWAFIVFWFIARIAFSIYTLRHEHSPPSTRTRFAYLNSAFYLLQHSFSFLALIHITNSDNLPKLVITSFWIIWWLLFLNYLSPVPTKKRIQPEIKALQNRTYGLLLAAVGTLATSVIVYLLSLYAKGKGVWIFTNPADSKGSLVLLAFGLVPAILLRKFLFPHIDQVHQSVKQLLHLDQLKHKIAQTIDSSQKKDPLDQSSLIVSLFMSSASFLYKAIEQNSIENVAAFIQKIFSFLFNKIENLTSIELWKNTLQMILNSSRKLQRWHPGFLRLNLFWFLFFIIILITVILNQRFVNIFPPG